MWTREKAMQIRKIIEKAAISLSDADASIAPEMFPRLKGDGSLIEHGTRICWQNSDGSLCIKRAAVDLWDNAQSTPDVAPNLWEDVAYHDGIRIIPEIISRLLRFQTANSVTGLKTTQCIGLKETVIHIRRSRPLICGRYTQANDCRKTHLMGGAIYLRRYHHWIGCLHQGYAPTRYRARGRRAVPAARRDNPYARQVYRARILPDIRKGIAQTGVQFIPHTQRQRRRDRSI